MKQHSDKIRWEWERDLEQILVSLVESKFHTSSQGDMTSKK